MFISRADRADIFLLPSNSGKLDKSDLTQISSRLPTNVNLPSRNICYYPFAIGGGEESDLSSNRCRALEVRSVGGEAVNILVVLRMIPDSAGELQLAEDGR
ncbi:hypothetical protein, partial [Mesorhizobium sp.]|uniref:hypothetical protein n=1 Tax=Mesorhizobium sp. TaxID=1871066 RepID=UPI00356528F7